MIQVKLESAPCDFALLSQASISELKALAGKFGITGGTKEILADRLLSTGAVTAQVKLSVNAKIAASIKKANSPAPTKKAAKKK